VRRALKDLAPARFKSMPSRAEAEREGHRMSRLLLVMSRLLERLGARRSDAPIASAAPAHAEAEAFAALALARWWGARAADRARRAQAGAALPRIACVLAATAETARRIEAARRGHDPRRPGSGGRVLH
jgi:hypothetical protein